MNTKQHFLKTLNDSRMLGKQLGKFALPGDVICLYGDLGAGKTTLTQAIAHGLEVPESHYITSPSFAILHEYPGRLPLYHMDFYRLTDVEEVLDLGFEEYFYMDGLTVIEWPMRAEEILPKDRLSLELTIKGENSRQLTAIYEKRWIQRMAKILA